MKFEWEAVSGDKSRNIDEKPIGETIYIDIYSSYAYSK